MSETPDQGSLMTEGSIAPQIEVSEDQLSEDELAELHANSGRNLGIPDVKISPKVWRISGDPEVARETLGGIDSLIDLIHRRNNRFGTNFFASTHEESQTGEETKFSGYVYCYGFQMSPEALENKREFLASEINSLLTKLQSPFRL